MISWRNMNFTAKEDFNKEKGRRIHLKMATCTLQNLAPYSRCLSRVDLMIWKSGWNSPLPLFSNDFVIKMASLVWFAVYVKQCWAKIVAREKLEVLAKVVYPYSNELGMSPWKSGWWQQWSRLWVAFLFFGLLGFSFPPLENLLPRRFWNVVTRPKIGGTDQ